MKDWKDSFRLLKYSFKIKEYMTGTIIFLALAVHFFCMQGAVMIGNIYIAAAFAFLSKLPAMLEPSGLVASSPKRKMVGIYLPDIIVGAGMFFICLIIQLLLNREEDLGYSLFLVYLILFLIQLVLSVVHRLLPLVVLLYTGLMVGCTMFLLYAPSIPDLDIDIDVANRIGFFLVVAGVVLGSILRRLVYRLPISKSDINIIYRKQG